MLIREDLSHNLLGALLAGHLDVLLLALPFPADQVETMVLFEDELFLATPKNHSLASRERLQGSDLVGEGVLLLEDGHCLRDHVLEACKLRDSQIKVPYQATSLSTIVQMVANGIGITLLPKMAVDAGIMAGTDLDIRAFDQLNVARDIGLMWRKKTPRRLEFKMLGDLIAEIIKK